jgi:hypothetical protein
MGWGRIRDYIASNLDRGGRDDWAGLATTGPGSAGKEIPKVQECLMKTCKRRKVDESLLARLLWRGGGRGRRLKERVGLVGGEADERFCVVCVSWFVWLVAFTVHYLSATAQALPRMYFWHKTTDVLRDSFFRYAKLKEEQICSCHVRLFCRGNSALAAWFYISNSNYSSQFDWCFRILPASSLFFSSGHCQNHGIKHHHVSPRTWLSGGNELSSLFSETTAATRNNRD